MLKKLSLSAAILLLGCQIGLADDGPQQYLQKEPPKGSLKQGQVVLVDDGSCPAGQVKQVTGGNGSTEAGGSNRQYKCVPKMPAP